MTEDEKIAEALLTDARSYVANLLMKERGNPDSPFAEHQVFAVVTANMDLCGGTDSLSMGVGAIGTEPPPHEHKMHMTVGMFLNAALQEAMDDMPEEAPERARVLFGAVVVSSLLKHIIEAHLMPAARDADAEAEVGAKTEPTEDELANIDIQDILFKALGPEGKA